RTPSSNGKLTTWANVPPKLRYSSPHVWHKEDAEDTDDNIELGRSELQIEHVANVEFDVLEAPVLGLSTRKRKQVLCKVHTEHRSMRSNGLRRRNCRSSTAAAHIKDTRSGADAQAGDRALAISVPERIDRMIVKIGSRVICASRSLLSVVWSSHSHSVNDQGSEASKGPDYSKQSAPGGGAGCRARRRQQRASQMA